ncbi:Protein-S-isoprenylcysteine O-methyltransferase Ste14 [Rhodoblastus acidophilus]|uniref:Protein-S-isoprenylcysteine O-methyltransferase Ste14 n=1 Tax=Rhodoblastus acidophilus TaxID=1074 RepID=A0A212S8U1_RHOAC|nr:Protein-S-isoprenylcysteine O-methyltransferase Ste14 [Rhodoblastus acidophilus]
MTHDAPAYGLWSLVIINSVFFIFFASSFTVGGWKKNWRELGMFSAFVLALFTEMYGFQLTIYFLSGWLATHYPGTDLMSHDSGHLWSTILGSKGDPHFSVLHIASSLLIGAGFVLLGYCWRPLYKAQRAGEVATTGPYARIRRPQYVAFVAVMLGFRVPEQGRRLRSAVQGGGRNTHDHRRRSETSRRPHRPHRRPAHLGVGADPPSPCPHHRPRRWPVAGRLALDRLQAGLLPVGARAVAPVPAAVPRRSRRASQSRRPGLLRRSFRALR